MTSDPPGIDCTGNGAGPGSGSTCDMTVPANTEVTLTGTELNPGATARFTGFHGGGCQTMDASMPCVFTPAGDVHVLARVFDDTNRIFVSSTVQHPGAFDNIDNADKLCKQLAGDAGVPGDFHAWMSSSQDTALARITQDFPGGIDPSGFVRVDGQIVAFDLLDDFVKGHFVTPPRIDERGQDVGDDALVATDTDGAGNKGTSNHCQDWASETSNQEVLAGEAAGGTDRWTAASSVACNEDAHIYCVTALSAHNFATSGQIAPVMWVSTGTVSGSDNLNTMDSTCATEAQAAGFPGNLNTALVTPGGGKGVAERFKGFSVPGPILRPDGFQVEASIDDLLAFKPFQSIPNLDANKQYIDANVWVGGGGFDLVATDCNGWSSEAGNGTGRPAATTRGHDLSVSMQCNELHRFWCLNYAAFAAVK